MSDRDELGLLKWQWQLYSGNHVDRRNLAMHLVTVPLFWSAALSLLASPLLGWPAAVVAPLVMGACIALQGRTHRLEVTPPVPFRGPADVVGRLLAEQFITFPRYVLSGQLAKAWSGAEAAR